VRDRRGLDRHDDDAVVQHVVVVDIVAQRERCGLLARGGAGCCPVPAGQA
jgi:hypothetical protein